MRQVVNWSVSLPSGEQTSEYAIAFDKARNHRLLVLPALFDEANKLRRTTVEIMHRLDISGIDSFLPDLPGCNDSLAPLSAQTLEGWRLAAQAAAEQFKATHCLTLRAGALMPPQILPGWRYAPVSGRKQLRAMMRARTIVAKEAGRTEDSALLDAMAKEEGIVLGGWEIGPELYSELVRAEPLPSDKHIEISQEAVGGSGLWLRAEPDEDPEQADAIAAIIAIGLDAQ